MSDTGLGEKGRSGQLAAEHVPVEGRRKSSGGGGEASGWDGDKGRKESWRKRESEE